MIVDIVKKREKNEFGNMSKEMFLKRIAEFHIGEWEKSINCKAFCDGTYAEIVFTYDNGQKIKYEFENDYPYNFRFFFQFIKGKDFETLN